MSPSSALAPSPGHPLLIRQAARQGSVPRTSAPERDVLSLHPHPSLDLHPSLGPFPASLCSPQNLLPCPPSWHWLLPWSRWSLSVRLSSSVVLERSFLSLRVLGSLVLTGSHGRGTQTPVLRLGCARQRPDLAHHGPVVELPPRSRSPISRIPQHKPWV